MRRRDKLKNIERANLLAEQRHLESKGVLTEGIIDKVKDILIGPINDLIDKLGDKGQEVYNKLVDSFGENPSMDTIKAKVQSELNEDRDFGKLGLMDDPKYADKEGKQNTTDKIMGVLSQIIGLNLSTLGGVPLAAAITVMLGLPVIGGTAIGAILSLIISFIIKGLADRYGHARAKQLDEATNLLAEQRHLESKGVLTEGILKEWSSSGADEELKQFHGYAEKEIEQLGLTVKTFDLGSSLDKGNIGDDHVTVSLSSSGGHGTNGVMQVVIPAKLGEDKAKKVSGVIKNIANRMKNGSNINVDFKFDKTRVGDNIPAYVLSVRLTSEEQQAGNPEELGLREAVVNKNASDGVDYISVNIKKDDDTSREVKGRVEPTDIGFIIYNEEYDNRPYNIV